MPGTSTNALSNAVREDAYPLTGVATDLLMELIGDARFVLVGEAPETFPSNL
jgi:hypothetical protein